MTSRSRSPSRSERRERHPEIGDRNEKDRYKRKERDGEEKYRDRNQDRKLTGYKTRDGEGYLDRDGKDNDRSHRSHGHRDSGRHRDSSGYGGQNRHSSRDNQGTGEHRHSRHSKHRRHHRRDHSTGHETDAVSTRKEIKPLPSQQELFVKEEQSEGEGNSPAKEKPNYNTSGALVAESNMINGSVLTYNEPADACKPPSKGKGQYRLFVFHGDSITDTFQLNQLSWYMFGTDTSVCHIPLASSSSCAEQHAVIQFRLISKKDRYGDETRTIKAYLIDLDTKGGTFLNHDLIPTTRFVELRNKDILQFGKDKKEYVLMVD